MRNRKSHPYKSAVAPLAVVVLLSASTFVACERGAGAVTPEKIEQQYGVSGAHTDDVGYPSASGHHQLRRGDVELQHPVTAHDAQREPSVDGIADHHALQVVGTLDRDIVDVEHDVRGAETGSVRRAAGDHLDHLDAVLATHRARHAGRQWTAATRDADVGAPEAPLAHERADDAPRRVVDGYREPQPDACDRGVDADQPAPAVDAGTAIGAIAGGKKGAALGATAGGIGGLIYDLATRNKQ